jgi:hypothetical protein
MPPQAFRLRPTATRRGPRRSIAGSIRRNDGGLCKSKNGLFQCAAESHPNWGECDGRLHGARRLHKYAPVLQRTSTSDLGAHHLSLTDAFAPCLNLPAIPAATKDFYGQFGCLTQILLSESYRNRGLPLSTLRRHSKRKKGKRRHLTNVVAILVRMGLTH